MRIILSADDAEDDDRTEYNFGVNREACVRERCFS